MSKSLFSVLLSVSGIISVHFGRVEAQRAPWHAMGSVEERHDYRFI